MSSIKLFIIVIVLIAVSIRSEESPPDNDYDDLEDYGDPTTPIVATTVQATSTFASNWSLSEQEANDDICTIDEIIDRLLPADYDQGKELNVTWKVDHINETFARIDRLIQLVNNYSATMSPLLQKVVARFSTIIYEISLPPECMSSLVVIGEAVAKRQLWAMKCPPTHSTLIY